MPKPKPDPVSDTARAIIENVPLPKPKPPVPSRPAAEAAAPTVLTDANAPIIVTPLPDTLNDPQTLTEPPPDATDGSRQAVPNTELR